MISARFDSSPLYIPFSSFNTATRYIRHAVSLDETNWIFWPQLYRNEDFTTASEVKKEEMKKKTKVGKHKVTA